MHARANAAPAGAPRNVRMEALAFDNSFARLTPSFFTRLDPVPLPDPYQVAASPSAAALIGLDPGELVRPEFAEVFAGNRRLAGTEPLAAVYAGHQFGVWAGRLGDGRALLLGEAIGPDGRCWELQLKGSGKTPYSRMGDGRAVLRSSIREFLCSEAMAALGIPTTRALAIVGSDQPVFRETVETAAVVTRMSPSFVRFGSFEYFAHFDRHAELRALTDYVIERFYPACRAASHRDTVCALLAEVSRRTGRLIAAWQSVGFCHGVMNTDNMSILGLTIDYGPFGFLDGFDAQHICNHSDDSGRYAYAMQPRIGEWNCFALGQALLPLIGDVESAQQALAEYRPAFEAEFERLLRAKLGLSAQRDDDPALFERMFEAMQASRVDFTLFFRSLSRVRAADAAGDEPVRDLFVDRAACDAWLALYRGRLQAEGSNDAQRAAAMNRVNPRFVLRNHLAELAIRRARGETDDGTPGGRRDYAEVARLLDVLSRPFDEQPEHASYAAPPPDWASHLSVSCSS